jgi:glycerophosphoryl diester phosphodiesterase
LRVKVYGHRGARGERAENTVAGFVYAAALGVAGVETDIALTADFVPVLHHDAALADGRLIKDVRFGELPEGVPALAAALRAAPGVEWLLEVKTYPDRVGETHAPGVMVREMLAVMGEARVCVLAFDWAVLREVAVQAPGVRRVCLTAPETVAAREVWWGAGFEGMSVPQAVAAAGAYGWAGFQGAMTGAKMAQARALGLAVFAWTVNEAEDYARLAGGVDGIITDFPARVLGWSGGIGDE